MISLKSLAKVKIGQIWTTSSGERFTVESFSYIKEQDRWEANLSNGGCMFVTNNWTPEFVGWELEEDVPGEQS